MALKITSNDIDHLSWIFSRMKSVHGESENLDYMHLFRQIIDNLRSDYSCVESKVETPEEKEAPDAIEQPKRTKVVYEKVESVKIGDQVFVFFHGSEIWKECAVIGWHPIRNEIIVETDDMIGTITPDEVHRKVELSDRGLFISAFEEAIGDFDWSDWSVSCIGAELYDSGKFKLTEGE